MPTRSNTKKTGAALAVANGVRERQIIRGFERVRRCKETFVPPPVQVKWAPLRAPTGHQ